MNRVVFGVLCGLVIGVIDVLIMIPLRFDTRRKKLESMVGAFLERFMLGLLIPSIQWGLGPIWTGAVLGIGLSVPTAVITRAYAPIVAVGLVLGIAVGYVTSVLY